MDKIYSRRRLLISKPNISILKRHKNKDDKAKTKALIIIAIVIIAIITFIQIIEAITPIVDKQCENIAKSVATRISNEQATIVMSRYNYDNLCNVIKDSNRKYFNDKCKCNNNK